MRKLLALTFLGLFMLSSKLAAQALGNAGTVEGVVSDPSGAVVPEATVRIRNTLTGYQQSTQTDASGSFRLTNIPANPYHLEVIHEGFGAYETNVDVRGSLPIA